MWNANCTVVAGNAAQATATINAMVPVGDDSLNLVEAKKAIASAMKIATAVLTDANLPLGDPTVHTFSVVISGHSNAGNSPVGNAPSDYVTIQIAQLS